MKRILCLSVIAVMLMSLAPLTAGAEPSYDNQYENLYYTKYDDHIEITYCEGDAVSVDIPAEIDGLPVTTIGDYAFEYCDSLTSVTIPNGVTRIGEYAFESCYSLTSIKIGTGITSIGAYAFYDTAYYNEASNWQDGVLYIDNCLIEANDELPSDYAIKNGTRFIADSAFYWRDSLTSVTIPSSVTSIGYEAFADCENLTSVAIENGVKIMDDEAFYNCYSLTDITIPNSVTSIGEYAFMGCEGLTDVTIPSGVTNIGNFAFNDCYGLVSITVDNQNKYYCSIDGNLFDKSKKTLIQYAAGKQDSQYTIPNGVTRIEETAFERCKSLINVTIPDSVTDIGNSAFIGCEGLTSVTIPNGVTIIGNKLFASCSSLTSVTMSNGVTDIGDNAFDGCDSLTDVYYSGSAADWQRIYIGDYNECLTDAAIHYNSVIDTEPTKFASMPTVSAGGNEEYTFSVSLQDIDNDCVMVAVIYDGKTLTGASAVNLSEGQTEATASVSAVHADKAKVFIWESIDGMKPLCHPQTVNIR